MTLGTERILNCFGSVFSYLDNLPVTKTRRDFAFHFVEFTQPVFSKGECRCNLRQFKANYSAPCSVNFSRNIWVL